MISSKPKSSMSIAWMVEEGSTSFLEIVIGVGKVGELRMLDSLTRELEEFQ